MNIIPITTAHRDQINDFILEHRYATTMVARGEVVDMTVLDGFVVLENDPFSS